MGIKIRALYSLFLVALINTKRNDVSSFLFVIASPQHSSNSKVSLNNRVLPSVPPGGSLSVQRSNTTSPNDTSSFYNTVTFENDSEKDALAKAGTSTSSSFITTSSSVHSSEALPTKVNINLLH